MLSGAEVSSPSDILQDIRNGSKQAEQELVERYWRGLIFVLNNQCQDPDLTHDLAQDTFIIVINKARNGDIHNPQGLSAFVRQTGINLAIGHFRKEKRRKTDSSETLNFDLPDANQNLSKELNESHLIKLVGQVLEELPTIRDREILQSYFVEGIDKSTLCEQHDLTPAHFDRVLFRARNRLKQLLQHKLGVDISQMTLTHLLSVFLCMQVFSFPEKNNVNEVRERIARYHYDYNADLMRISQKHVSANAHYQPGHKKAEEQHNG